MNLLDIILLENAFTKHLPYKQLHSPFYVNVGSGLLKPNPISSGQYLSISNGFALLSTAIN